jgi:hypothetical protein
MGAKVGNRVCGDDTSLESTHTAEMHHALRTTGLAVAAFLLAAIWLGGLTGDPANHRFVAFLAVAWRDGAVALLWWAGAVGLGLGLMRLAVGPNVRAIARAAASGTRNDDTTTSDEIAIAVVLGAAAMLALDNVLGTIGLLAAGGGLVGWLVAAGGTALGIRVLRNAPLARPTHETARPRAGLETHLAPIALGAMTALLLVAASSAPGWLWSSEFGGYDALSYHLVLARAWSAGGIPVGPVDGNVYSALPSFVEAAFAHLMVLRGDVISGAIACQWWAAIATLATAFVVARLARNAIGPPATIFAAMIFLAVPWVTVVGTLAYNDIAPCLFLAGGWLLVLRAVGDGNRLDARAAAALALIAAAAVGAKPTAFFFTALPLLAIVLLTARLRALRLAPLVLLVAVGVLAPWLVRNALHEGNPVFPFASGIFGNGRWTEEQIAVFSSAHSPDRPILDRLPLIFEQWLTHGFGAPPSEGEPWFPQWSVIPAVGLFGLIVAFRRHPHARTGLAVVTTICVSWLLVTHLKSRFLLPTAVPLALGTTWFALWLTERSLRRALPMAAAIAVAVPFVVFLREPGKGRELRAPAAAIDTIPDMTGDSIARALVDADRSGDTELRRRLLEQSTTPFAINHLLPPEARVIGIGFATPFYIRRPVAMTTVWDRGDFDHIAEQFAGTPSVWGSELRKLGYTHAILEPTMLNIWSTRGWLNPQLSRGEWVEPFIAANSGLMRTADGRIIIELSDGSPR